MEEKKKSEAVRNLSARLRGKKRGEGEKKEQTDLSKKARERFVS